MKKFIAGILLFAGASLFTLNSCKKTDKPVAAPTTVLSTIKNDPSLTIFSAIESRSGDDAIVNAALGIIVPVDTAFINAGITAAVAATFSTATCDSIVKYYTAAGGVNLNGATNTETAFTSDLGSSLYADSTATAIYFDGVPSVAATPIVVGSADIYKITQFINVPVASASQIITADANLSLFNEAFNRTNLAASFTTGTFTLFMPTNSAFNNAGFPDIASIDAADINALTQILLYHAVSNKYFDNDLANQTSLATLQGGSIQVSTVNGLQLTGNSDPNSPASLVNNGILGGNVLTYKINSVLTP